MKNSENLDPGRVFAGRYTLIEIIGNGSFGKIASVIDAESQQVYAMKLESLSTRSPQLEIEAHFYKKLSGMPNFPRVYYYGIDCEFRLLVMDMLGKSIEYHAAKLNYKFSLKTVLMLADQMFSAIEYLHKLSIIHRDIKPDNFMLGTGKNSNQVYLIDFGLSKEYISPENKEHIPYRRGLSLTGTARYASVSALQGCEQSRRDDLESLGYIFIFLLKGSLPWQGLPAKTSAQKYERILKVKSSTPLEALCQGLPKEFLVFMKAIKKLEFVEEPAYAQYRSLFRNLFMKLDYEFNYSYDWLIKPRAPRQRRVAITNPDTPNNFPIANEQNTKRREATSRRKMPRIEITPKLIIPHTPVGKMRCLPKCSANRVLIGGFHRRLLVTTSDKN